MAWRAQVDQLIGLTADGEFSIQVDYYDDADPANAAAGSRPGSRAPLRHPPTSSPSPRTASLPATG
jgi:hypothetical protein